MIVVSVKDFRANQSRFMDMARQGEDVVLKSRKNGSFRLVPIYDDDKEENRDNIMEDLEGALLQVKEHLDGKRKLKSLDELIDEL